MAQIGFGGEINKTAQQFGYDQYKTSLSDVLKATAEETWNFNPTQSIESYGELFFERQAPEGEAPVPRDQLNKEYSSLGLFFEEDEYQSVVDIMVDAKEAERERQDIISRGPQGLGVGIAKFGVGLGVSLLDPVNLASAFIPIVGQARMAQLVARYGFGRARLARGFTEGAVGAALVEPIVYGSAQALQADYGVVDSFLNITFGSILGGGLHVSAGKLKDFNTQRKFKKAVKQARKDLKVDSDVDPELNLYKEYYPENSKIMRDLEKTDPATRKVLLEKSLNDMLNERPVDVSDIVDADPILRQSSDTAAKPKARMGNGKTDTEAIGNTVEANTVNKTADDIETDLETLTTKLEEARARSKQFKFDEADIDLTTKELDEINTKPDDVDVAIKDAINCMNGR